MIQKQSNEYARGFGRLYAKTPKSVFAAVAFSHCSAGGDLSDEAVKNFVKEWKTLWENGIVPQRPPTIQTWPSSLLLTGRSGHDH